MKCYQHRTHDAVGVCKSCGKAVCAACAVDLGFAITCPGKCQNIAATYHQLNANAQAIYSAQKRSKFIAPAFVALFGVLILMFEIRDGLSFNFMSVFGSMFVLFGAILFVIQRRLMKNIHA